MVEDPKNTSVTGNEASESGSQGTAEVQASVDGSFVADIPTVEGMPICAYCGAEPLMPQFRPIQIGAVRAVMFFCSKCRKPVPMFMLPAMPQQRPTIVPGRMPLVKQ